MDALDSEAEGGEAHAGFAFAAEGEGLGEGLLEDAVELAHDFAFVPEEALEVLHPFEVADDDTASVAEDVGDDEDVAALVDDGISFGCRGAVGTFGEDFAADLRGVGGGPHLRGGRGALHHRVDALGGDGGNGGRRRCLGRGGGLPAALSRSE